MMMHATGVALLVAGAAAIAFLQLRHLGLLALALAAPVPGLALYILTASHGQGVPFQLLSLAWLFAFTFSLLLIDECVSGIRDGSTSNEAVRHAIFDRLGTVFLAISCVLLAALFGLMLVPGGEGPGTAAAMILFAAATSCAVLVWLARYLSYTEDFIARTNRGREAWHRALDGAIAFAQPRWGFTVAGIGLVFTVLGVFGAQRLHMSAVLYDRSPILFSGIGLLLAGASWITTRDWRAAVSLLAAIALAGVIGLWGLALWGRPLDAASFADFCLVLGIAALPLFVAASEAGRYGRGGDDATLAEARTHMRIGPDLFFASLSMVVGLAGSALAGAEVCGVLLPMAVFAAAGLFLFRPAFAVVIEACFPRSSTLHRRYRIS